MSKKEMEKSLNYGDCNNVFCFLYNILESVGEKVEKTIDATIKKD
jgi:hypothetical protein